MMIYLFSGLKNSHPYRTDCLSNYVNSNWKQYHQNVMQMVKLIWFRETLLKNLQKKKRKKHPQQLHSDNVFTYETKNTNCSDKRRIIILAFMLQTIIIRKEMTPVVNKT